jgi:hypothetical protein
MRILALDLATETGAADGLTTDQKPRLWSWYLADAGEGRPRRLAFLRRFVDSYLAEFKPDLVVFELPLNIATIASMMAKGIYVTKEDTLAFLRGSIGVVECCAGFAGVEIRGVDIKTARKHLTGRATYPDGGAKDATMRACRALGWNAANHNESDAAALWSLAVGQSNPKMAAAVRAAMGGEDATGAPPAVKRKRGSRGDLFGPT